MLSIIYHAILAFVCKVAFLEQFTYYARRAICVFASINNLHLDLMLISHIDTFYCISMQNVVYLFLIDGHLSASMANEVNSEQAAIVESALYLAYLAWTSNYHDIMLSIDIHTYVIIYSCYVRFKILRACNVLHIFFNSRSDLVFC